MSELYVLCMYIKNCCYQVFTWQRAFWTKMCCQNTQGSNWERWEQRTVLPLVCVCHNSFCPVTIKEVQNTTSAPVIWDVRRVLKTRTLESSAFIVCNHQNNSTKVKRILPSEREESWTSFRSFVKHFESVDEGGSLKVVCVRVCLLEVWHTTPVCWFAWYLRTCCRSEKRKWQICVGCLLRQHVFTGFFSYVETVVTKSLSVGLIDPYRSGEFWDKSPTEM